MQNSNQIIKFPIQEIQLDSYKCSKSKAQYDFAIIISSFSIQLVLVSPVSTSPTSEPAL